MANHSGCTHTRATHGGGYADALVVRLGSLARHVGHFAEVGFGVLLLVSDSTFWPAMTALGTPGGV